MESYRQRSTEKLGRFAIPERRRPWPAYWENLIYQLPQGKERQTHSQGSPRRCGVGPSISVCQGSRCRSGLKPSGFWRRAQTTTGTVDTSEAYQYSELFPCPRTIGLDPDIRSRTSQWPRIGASRDDLRNGICARYWVFAWLEFGTTKRQVCRRIDSRGFPRLRAPVIYPGLALTSQERVKPKTEAQVILAD